MKSAPRKTPPPSRQHHNRAGMVSGRRNFGSYTSEHRKLLYDTSRWQAFLYGARHSATEKAEKGLHEPIRTDAAYMDAKAGAVAEMAESIGRELFGRLYADPEKLKKPNAPRWMGKVHQLLDGMPEWEQLRKSVEGDPDFSALATKTMLDAVSPRLAELISQSAEEEKAEAEGRPAPEGPPGLPSAADGMRAALRAAANKAAKNAQEAKDALAGIAPGLDGTPPGNEQSDTDRFDLLQAIMADPKFQEIARRAGRIKRISGRAEMRRSKDAYEEVVDIELGQDLSRLLPTEIMNLLDDDLETMEMARIMDAGAMVYRLEGHEPQGRGPVIFLRDISGSMSGDPHLWGAAVAVALVGQTWRERRPMLSATFNHEVHSCRRLDPTGLYDLDRRAKPEGEDGGRRASGRTAPAVAAMAHVKDACDGGTTFDAPLRFAFDAGIREPRADFIFLTDGQAYCADNVLNELNALKATGLRVFGMTVNGGSVSGPLQAICDEIVDIDKCKGNEEEIARKLGRSLRAAR